MDTTTTRCDADCKFAISTWLSSTASDLTPVASSRASQNDMAASSALPISVP
ncbi:Uncharacterised protein [Mycobacteroides abscessus subsp. abscessus]|nr:Uncharacterised protein [Mycobacteroides abscessus subsp. abscessus]